MMLAWMVLPLPPWVGAPLLWDHVQPWRMQYAAGLLLLCLLVVAVRSLGLRFSLARLVLLCAVASTGWWASEFSPATYRSEDLIILPLIAVGYTIARRYSSHSNMSLACTSLLAGMWLFGWFNPLQAAWPIFNRPPSKVIEALDHFAAGNEGVIAIEALHSAIGNGLGYRSLNHVTAVPQLEFWRKRFPDMPVDEFRLIFNRYAHIMAVPEPAPRLVRADLVAVPISLVRAAAPVIYGSPPAPRPDIGGNLERASIENGQLTLSGWAPWRGGIEMHILEISLSLPTAGPAMRSIQLRPDLVVATKLETSLLNGFVIRIPLQDPAAPLAACIVAHDPTTGERFLLPNPANLPPCQPDSG